jgi:hypothetical protein
MSLAPQTMENMLGVLLEIRDILRRQEARAIAGQQKRSRLPRRRGPKPVHDPLKDNQLVEDWRNSGMSQREFENGRNLPARSILNAVDRCRKRCQDP